MNLEDHQWRIQDFQDEETRISRGGGTDLLFWPLFSGKPHKIIKKTRMHSIRMCTARSSGHLSCHVCPPPHHAHLLQHMPPATHALLPCMPPCHACPPPAMHAPCPCEQNHRHLWKHNLAATSLQAVKNCAEGTPIPSGTGNGYYLEATHPVTLYASQEKRCLK